MKWVSSTGVGPSIFGEEDRFVDPLLEAIVKNDEKMPGRAYYWVPNLKGMKQWLREQKGSGSIEVEKLGDNLVTRLQVEEELYVGWGIEEGSSILSALNQMRSNA